MFEAIAFYTAFYTMLFTYLILSWCLKNVTPYGNYRARGSVSSLRRQFNLSLVRCKKKFKTRENQNEESFGL